MWNLQHAVEEHTRLAERLYNRLVLVVGECGTATFEVLRNVSEGMNAPLINIGLELSRRLLDLAERQRSIRVRNLLEQVVDETESDIVILYRTEILFDVTLRQDPMRLLQGLSRNRTVIATWDGTINENNIEYAVAGHPEHRRCPIDGVLIVRVDEA